MQQSSCHFRVAPNLCCKAIKSGAIDDDIFIVNDIWNKSYMNCGNEMKMKKWSSQWTQFMHLRKEAWKKKVLNFFQASLRNCINCVHCDDHFFILIFLFSFKWNSFSRKNLGTQPHFESESFWNSEMAFLVSRYSFLKTFCSQRWENIPGSTS